jgi:hypothetical protein
MTHPALCKMKFTMLDAAFDLGADRVAKSAKELIPYLMEIKTRLSAQGRRSDLKDTPDMTWNEWKQSKRDKLCMAPSTVDLLLRSGDTKREKPYAPKQPPVTVSGSESEDEGTTESEAEAKPTGRRKPKEWTHVEHEAASNELLRNEVRAYCAKMRKDPEYTAKLEAFFREITEGLGVVVEVHIGS